MAKHNKKKHIKQRNSLRFYPGNGSFPATNGDALSQNGRSAEVSPAKEYARSRSSGREKDRERNEISKALNS